MKTERITILGSPEFKAFLASEALAEGVSVSELIRQRCERKPSEDEELLLALAAELQQAVKSAKVSLADGIAAVNDTLKEALLLKGMK